MRTPAPVGSDVVGMTEDCLVVVPVVAVGLLVTLGMHFWRLSETLAISVEEEKSAKARYIRVAAIDIVSSDGIRNMIFTAPDIQTRSGSINTFCR